MTERSQAKPDAEDPFRALPEEASQIALCLGRSRSAGVSGFAGNINNAGSLPSANDNSDSDNKQKSKIVVLPYIDGLHNKFKSILKTTDYKLVTKPINKFTKLITLGKDKIDTMQTSGVVYQINCTTCNKVYLGQTGRKLNKRMYEHKYSIRKKEKTTGIAEHCINSYHKADFDNVKILDCEPNKFKRLFSEMFHIHKNKKISVNHMMDTIKLKSEFKRVIDNISNKKTHDKNTKNRINTRSRQRLD